MNIQVLGSGCSTCKKLNELTREAVKQLDLSVEVEYVTGNDGIQKMIELGSVTSPVIAVDGKIVLTGFTPDLEEIKKKIKKAIDSA